MRDLTTKATIEKFMCEFGRHARSEARVYFTGGTTAVLAGWRDSTVDIDLRFDPELDELFRAIPEIKERLKINVELASPSDFIPLLPGWESRCEYIGREGKVSYFNYDPYSQALSKIERGHEQDRKDIKAMIDKGLVLPNKLLELFHRIEPMLYKFPAIDPRTFAEKVFEFVPNAIKEE